VGRFLALLHPELAKPAETIRPPAEHRHVERKSRPEPREKFRSGKRGNFPPQAAPGKHFSPWKKRKSNPWGGKTPVAESPFPGKNKFAGGKRKQHWKTHGAKKGGPTPQGSTHAKDRA
jgi:hypothetical protein